MICDKCKEQKKVSRVMDHGGSKTLMAFDSYYDDDGLYHIHDPNWRTNSYTCSNGHAWYIKRRFKCINCDYGKDDFEIKYFDEQIGKL